MVPIFIYTFLHGYTIYRATTHPKNLHHALNL